MADQSNLSRLFQTAGQNKQQTGTGYTNLNKLVEASSGNQLGQKVAGNVQSQIGNVQTQLGEQQKQFETESEKNKVGGQADVEKANAVIGRFNDASGSASMQKGAGPTEEETTQFQKYLGGQYSGPQGLKDTSALQSTANQLKSQVSNFSPAGTQELLRRSVGGNRYTQGQQRLDTLLMDKSQLTPVQRQASTLGQQIQRADVAASGQAEMNKNLAQTFAQQTGEQLNKGLSGIDTSVQGQLAQAQTAEKTRLANLAAIQAAASSKSGTGLERSEALRQQLLNSGVDANQVKQIFGDDVYATQKAKQAAGQYVSGLSNNFWNTNNLDYMLQAAPEATASYFFHNTPVLDTYKNLKGTTFGGAANAGTLDALLSRVGASTAATSGLAENQAQNISAQGVASESQRANYEALNKLLGKTDTKYAQQYDALGNPLTYKAGKLGVNAGQI